MAELIEVPFVVIFSWGEPRKSCIGLAYTLVQPGYYDIMTNMFLAVSCRIAVLFHIVFDRGVMNLCDARNFFERLLFKDI